LQNETQYIQQDTIDLRELFSILKKRKKLIGVMTGLLTLLAIVYAFVLAKPVYEVKTMIEIGQIDAKPIDNFNNIQQKLSYEYKVNVKGKKIKFPRVKAISAPKKSDNIISLLIHSNNNEEWIQYIQTVIDKIQKQYQEKTDAYTSNQKELIALTQEDIRSNREDLIHMKKELANYSQKIVSLKSEYAALAGIYALQIGQKQTDLQALKKYISRLKSKEQKLKLSTTYLMMKPTRIIGGDRNIGLCCKTKEKTHCRRCIHHRSDTICLSGISEWDKEGRRL